jgi:2-amino-4-hydroxy-6-hydroxymethyldihydropteridine diphosphokinase
VDRVAIALGSNLGDRRAHLDFGVAKLRSLLRHIAVSRYHDTVPVGITGPQPLYLNAAATGETTLSARDLLDALLAIEAARGRERPYPNAPRTLDLDLILHGRLVVDDPGLIVPHPRFRERRFVLEPLAEIEPEMIDPVTGRTIRELLADAPSL